MKLDNYNIMMRKESEWNQEQRDRLEQRIGFNIQLTVANTDKEVQSG